MESGRLQLLDAKERSDMLERHGSTPEPPKLSPRPASRDPPAPPTEREPSGDVESALALDRNTSRALTSSDRTHSRPTRSKSLPRTSSLPAAPQAVTINFTSAAVATSSLRDSASSASEPNANDENSVAREEDRVPLEIRQGLLETYWTMKERWWSRVTRGDAGGVIQSFHFMWFLSYALGDAIFCVTRLHDDKFSYMEFLVLTLASGFFALMSPRWNWSGRVALMLVYLGMFLFFVLDIYGRTDYSSALILVSLVALSLLATFLFFFIYPHITRWYVIRLFSMASSKGPEIVVEDPSNPDLNSYEFEERSLAWLCYPPCYQPPTYKVIYKGPLRNGKPNGMGQWMDTNYRGEHLVGYWQDGCPVGPFDSEEADTGNLFTNLRMIFSTNGKGFRKMDVKFGVASVECSVSGSFLAGYPLVSFIKEPTPCHCRAACHCVKGLLENCNYRHINEMLERKRVVVSIDPRTESLTVTGFESTRRRPQEVKISVEKAEGRRARLALDPSWAPSAGTGEALLFIHGLNHTLEDGVRRFGQLLGLAHFPAHIKPFLFHWPAGTSFLTYWCAYNISAETSVHYDLRSFIESIRNAGIRHLHVVMHSMGTRVFLRSFAALKELLTERFPHVYEDGTTSKPAGSFGSSGSAAGPSSSQKEPVGKSPSFADRDGRSTAGDEEAAHSTHNDKKMSLLSLTFLNPDYDLACFRDTDFCQIRKYCDQVTLYADNRDVAIQCARWFQAMTFCFPHAPNLGHCVRPLKSQITGRNLDIDIVDTSDLQHNMSSHYHSAFNVNRGLVDDLHDIIVSRLRAEDRKSRLTYRDGYYRFLVVPPSVVMV
eukprot:tig00000448_g909.t1